jgi:DtxR family transcriptional regulator, Mn-dependent transcriptional regulator
MPTAALEEYLEAIYKLGQEGPVRPSQVAEWVGVSGPTVTATLRRLASRGLVVREGTKVVLTPDGVQRALEIVRRHRVAETFLVQTLGLDWEAAHEEACRLEHALSDRVLHALEDFLGNPGSCPHGHPIPGADGSLVSVAGTPLSDLKVGSAATVVAVAEEIEGMLAYLGSVGLRPGACLTVVESAPFEGPLTLECEGRRVALAREVARLVTVQPE